MNFERFQMTFKALKRLLNCAVEYNIILKIDIYYNIRISITETF